MNRIRKIGSFVARVAKVAYRKVVNFAKGLYHHAESIVILTLAALGLNALLGELPFYFILPMWVEATMVIPVLAVILVSLLTKSAEWRHNRRMVIA